jgi:hypothetical protein
MTDHPITPPPELVEQWTAQGVNREAGTAFMTWFATQAARWGSNQELEACCEWLDEGFGDVGNLPATLRAARRPKPPSLRELALESVKRFEESGEFFSDQMRELEFIRKALEQLDD